MHKRLKLCLILALATLPACAKGPGGMPYEAWYLGFFAPNYMQVWIETADVVDVHGKVFLRAMSGIAGIQNPVDLRGNPKGWPSRVGLGKGKNVTGAAPPRVIYVRWQSLVEPQTYYAYIPIPEATRKAMLAGERVFCAFDRAWITDYRSGVTVGLAPGGIVKVWITGACGESLEVTRVQAKVVEVGPYGGQSDGHYYPLSEVPKAYIEKYGVPYGSW